MNGAPNEAFLGFSLLFIAISGISLVFKRFRLPIVLAPVLFGVFMRYTPLAPLLGTEGFHRSLDVLADLGVLFLLFYIGLQIDYQELKRFGKPILELTAYSILFPFLLGALLIGGLGYGPMLAIVIGMTRIPVAEAVVVPILDEFGLTRTKVGQFILGPGVLDDVIEVALVALVSVWIAHLTGAVADVSALGILGHILLFVAAAFAGYRWLIPFFGGHVDHSPRITMAFCVAVLFFFAGFAEMSGLGLVIGALVAGMVVRPWLDALKGAGGERVVDAIQLAAYGFVGIFFFYQVGSKVDPRGILAEPLLVLALFLAGTLGKLLSAMVMFRRGALTFREAVLVGVGLDVRMTTELIIAQMLFSAGAIDARLYTALIAASSLSMITVPSILTFLLRRWGKALGAGQGGRFPDERKGLS